MHDTRESSKKDRPRKPRTSPSVHPTTPRKRAILAPMAANPPRTKARSKAALAYTEGAQPPRMRPALRHAVDLIATKGYRVPDAATLAGMNEKALYRALARPPIAAYVEAMKANEASLAASLKEQARAMAIRAGIDLLHNAQSEQVRARMVEFFASEERKNPAVAVQINVDRGGYEYARPGAQIVEILPGAGPASGALDGAASDTGSGDDDA